MLSMPVFSLSEVPSTNAPNLLNETIHVKKVTQNNEAYKDSFYFKWKNKNYLAVSDFDRGGISVLIGGGNGSEDSNYTLYDHIFGGNNWAPYVYNNHFEGKETLWFITTHFALNESYLEAFTYDLETKTFGNKINLQNAYGMEPGHTDASIYYHNNYWYLFTAQWKVNVKGSKLMWQKASSFFGPYGPTNALLDQNGNPIDRNRGEEIDYVVEAPHIGWTIPSSLGNINFPDIYWSIGPSDPKPGVLSAIRRGDLNFDETEVPFVFVFGEVSGPGLGNMVPGNTENFKYLTHPDTTANGNIRATTQQNGRFCIVNSERL